MCFSVDDKAASADWYAEGCEFKFHCTPYFLHLKLPHRLIEDGRQSAKYDIEAGTMIIHIPKAEPGLFFPNLDMLSTLLSHSSSRSLPSRPSIELVGSDDGNTGDILAPEDAEATVVDFANSVILAAESEPKIKLAGRSGYGFNSQYSDFFAESLPMMCVLFRRYIEHSLNKRNLGQLEPRRVVVE